METEDELIAVLGEENTPGEEVVEDEVLPTDNEIQLVEVPNDFEVQNLENIPFVVTTGGDDIFTTVENANEIIEDANNSSMEGCVVCSYLVSTPSDAGLCDTCESPCHKSCLKSSSESQHVMVCTLCYQKELMDREMRGTKRKQEKQASDMLVKSARRYK